MTYDGTPLFTVPEPVPQALTLAELEQIMRDTPRLPMLRIQATIFGLGMLRAKMPIQRRHSQPTVSAIPFLPGEPIEMLKRAIGDRYHLRVETDEHVTLWTINGRGMKLRKPQFEMPFKWEFLP